MDIILDTYTIDKVAIEDRFFVYNPKTALKLALFCGDLSLKMFLSIINYEEYTPLQIKKSITRE
jgi:crossover junction endodeoxyribonuclease RuvC